MKVVTKVEIDMKETETEEKEVVVVVVVVVVVDEGVLNCIADFDRSNSIVVDDLTLHPNNSYPGIEFYKITPTKRLLSNKKGKGKRKVIPQRLE